jgi:serine/threonine protein kinase
VYKEANGDVATIFLIGRRGKWNLDNWMKAEIKAGYGLDHPHIASVSEVFFDGTNMCIVVPDLQEKTLFGKMNEMSKEARRRVDADYQSALDSWMADKRMEILQEAPFTEYDSVKSLVSNMDTGAVTRQEVVDLLDVHSKTKLAAKMKSLEELYKAMHPKERYQLGFSEDKARWYFQQLILVMDYCQAKDVHLDYKAEHLYLDTTVTPHILKVLPADFARYNRYTSGPPAHVGELRYFAPEQFRSRRDLISNNATDVWKAGIILNIMLTGRMPYRNSGEINVPTYETYRRIAQGMVALPPALDVNVSRDCIDLLQKMLVVNPEQRISMAQIKAHPWFVKNLPEGALAMNDALEAGVYPPIDHVLDNFGVYVPEPNIPLPLGQFPELDADWDFNVRPAAPVQRAAPLHRAPSVAAPETPMNSAPNRVIPTSASSFKAA